MFAQFDLFAKMRIQEKMEMQPELSGVASQRTQIGNEIRAGALNFEKKPDASERRWEAERCLNRNLV